MDSQEPQSQTQQQKKSRVRVAIRIRPMIPRQIANNEERCLSIPSNKQIILGNSKQFSYDHVFGESSQQKTVYDSCVRDLVVKCFEGYNSAILAYGQTGSGKTFTMGTSYNTSTEKKDLGVIPRVIDEIFAMVEERKSRTKIKIKSSFLEIYNEEIIDLLLPIESSTTGKLNNGSKKEPSSISIREEKDGSIGIYGITEQESQKPEEMINLLERGSYNRTTSSTLMNNTSSRSHAIFTIFIEQEEIEKEKSKGEGNSAGEENRSKQALNEGNSGYMTAKFFFVDLAGSERAKKTGATGSTLKEGININMGLLELGNVISALSSIAEKQSSSASNPSASQFISYRNSKLTRILQDCLGGNSNTYMIACISPAESNFDESLNTLKYASKAMNIKNKPIVNRDPQTALILQLKQKIYDIGVENHKLQQFVMKELEISSKKELSERILSKMGTSLSTSLSHTQSDPSLLRVSSMGGDDMDEVENQLKSLKKAQHQLRSKYQSLQTEYQKNRKQLNDLEIKNYQMVRELSEKQSAITQLIENLTQKCSEKQDLQTKEAELIKTFIQNEISKYKQALTPEGLDENPSSCNSEDEERNENQNTHRNSNKPKTIIEKYQQRIEEAEQSLHAKDQMYERLEAEYSKLERQAQSDEKILIKKNKQIYILTKKLNELNSSMTNNTNDQNKNSEKQNTPLEAGSLGVGSKKKGSKTNQSADRDQESDGEQSDDGGDVTIDEEHQEEIKEMEARFKQQTEEKSQKEMQEIERYIKEKEEFLEKITANQINMEYELISEMKEEYHMKIELLEKEKKNLTKQRDETMSGHEKGKFVSTIDTLEKELKNYRKKLKEQKNMESQLSSQNTQVRKLAEQIKAVKLQKKEAARKLKEQKEQFHKEKNLKIKEILKAKKQIMKKDNLLRKQKMEKEKDAIKGLKKEQQVQKYKRVNETLKGLLTSKKQREAASTANLNKFGAGGRKGGKQSHLSSVLQKSKKQTPQSPQLSQKEIQKKIEHLLKKITESITVEKNSLHYEEKVKELKKQYNQLLDQESSVTLKLERLRLQTEGQEHSDLIIQGSQGDRTKAAKEESLSTTTVSQQQAIEQSELQGQLLEVTERISNIEDSLKYIQSKQKELLESCPLYRSNEQSSDTEMKRAGDGVHYEILETELLYDKHFVENASNVRAFYQAIFKTIAEQMKDSFVLLELKEKTTIEIQSLRQQIDDLQQSNRKSKSDFYEQLRKVREQLAMVQMYSNGSGSGNVYEKPHSRNNPNGPYEEQHEEYNPNVYKKIEERQKKNLQKKISELTKNNRQLIQEIQIWKRKCNIVQDKYQNMKNLMCKDKNIGRGNINASTVSHLSGQEEQQGPNVSSYAPKFLKQTSQNSNILNDVEEIISECDKLQSNHTKANDGLHGSNKGGSLLKKSMSTNLHLHLHGDKEKASGFFAPNRMSAEHLSSDREQHSERERTQFSEEDELYQGEPQIQSSMSSSQWECMAKIDAHTSSVLSITSHSNILISTATKSLKIWDLETNKIISDLSGPHLNGFVKSVMVDPERNLMFTACEKQITIWDMITLNIQGVLKGHKDEIRALHMNSGDLLCSGGKGHLNAGSLLVWDMRNLNPNVPMEEKEKNHDIFTFESKGKMLFYGTRNHQVRRMNLETMQILSPFEPPHMDSVMGLATIKEDRLISASKDKNLKLWNISSSSSNQFGSGLCHTVHAFNDYVTVCQKSQKLPLFYTGSRDGQVKVGCVSPKDRIEFVGGMLAHTQSVNSICSLEETNNAIATASADKTIKLWKPTSETELNTYNSN